VIRSAIIHFSGRLPLVADLRNLPDPSDQSVLATNVRTRDGKRPSFADDTESWFLIPLREVLAIELPSSLFDKSDEAAHAPPTAAGARPTVPAPASVDPDDAVIPLAAGPGSLELGTGALELDDGPLEPDEELLARIRQL
jgi:hypothetical protein